MIVVLGSINSDVVLRVPHLPAPGETLRASNVAIYPGGKGANQAVAAARMGADVRLVGRVGRDGGGVLDAIRGAGVDTSAVHVDDDAMTGTALITVAEDGTNTIVTSGGANHVVGHEELRALEGAIEGASMLLVQLEVPMDVVVSAVDITERAGVPVMLDPAPVTELPDELWPRLAWITPNEQETLALCGVDPAGETSAREAARTLHARGVRHAVVTLGDRGAVHDGIDGEHVVAATSVTPVDTVACGDAFNGALAATLETGAATADALRVACAAGALAATKPGAFPSLPQATAVAGVLGD